MTNREIFNLNYLLRTQPDIIPTVNQILNDSYSLEKCYPIECDDFQPTSFKNLYSSLLIKLYSQKADKFSPGLYKYFNPCSLNHFIMDFNYFKYINLEIKYFYQTILNSFRTIHYNEKKLNLNLKRINELSNQLINWKPKNGFNLLHGDLHIGNIIKKNGDFFLIDYEFMRYGPKELEIMNFIFSALIFYHSKGFETEQIEKILDRYYISLYKIGEFDNSLLKLFENISIFMYYTKGITQNNFSLIDLTEYFIDSRL